MHTEPFETETLFCLKRVDLRSSGLLQEKLFEQKRSVFQAFVVITSLQSFGGQEQRDLSSNHPCTTLG